MSSSARASTGRECSVINRRSFVARAAGMFAAVLTGHRVAGSQPAESGSRSHLPPVHLRRSVKVYTGEMYVSRETMEKLAVKEGAFVEWAERAMAEAQEKITRDLVRMYG